MREANACNLRPMETSLKSHDHTTTQCGKVTGKSATRKLKFLLTRPLCLKTDEGVFWEISNNFVANHMYDILFCVAEGILSLSKVVFEDQGFGSIYGSFLFK